MDESLILFLSTSVPNFIIRLIRMMDFHDLLSSFIRRTQSDNCIADIYSCDFVLLPMNTIIDWMIEILQNF